MTSLHGPMTNTATSISQSLQLLTEPRPIESAGKGSSNLDLAKAADQSSSNTTFSSNEINQETSEIEDLKRQAQATEFGASTAGNFQYSATSQNSNAAQTAINLASDHQNQLRVMTVHSNDPGQSTVSALSGANFTISSAGATQVTQVQNVLSSAEVVSVDNNGQVQESNADGTKYTYYPAAVQATDASQGAAGQFYVMMSPQDMIPTAVSASNPQRIIAPRGHQIASMTDAATFAVEGDTAIPVEFRKVEGGGRSSRDERRRATHNEVERRRRDKINSWIMKLASVVPECQEDQTKQGQVSSSNSQSKGGILSKALDYIGKLRTTNERLAETMKDHDRVIVENQVLRQQTEELRRENALLRANLHMQHQEHVEVAAAEAQQMDTAH